jgi:hypothetical protein
MYDTAREAIEALGATPEVLARLLRDVSDAQARAARGGDEGWSVVEVVCHMRDAEEIGFQRMQALRDAAKPVIAGFDQAALARDRNYAAADLRSALEEFRDCRAAHVAALRELRAAQWERIGQHSAHGPVTILNHTLHTLWHDAIHLAQLARQLS